MPCRLGNPRRQPLPRPRKSERLIAGWQRACCYQELREGNPVGVRIDGVAVALFRVGDGCYAVQDICTHEYARLSDGYQDGEIVECPLHQAQFDVRTGKCVLEPAKEDLATYEVKLEGEDVFVRLGP